MWRTPQGTRILVDSEARLYKIGVLAIKEWLDDTLEIHDPYFTFETGVLSFDWMEPEEKLIALFVVSKGLLDGKSPALVLSPWHIATSYAVYANMKTMVDVEIDIEHTNYLRKNITDAYLEASDSLGEYDTVINPNDDNSEEWHDRIDTLAAFVVDVEIARNAVSRGAPHVSDSDIEDAHAYLRNLEV